MDKIKKVEELLENESVDVILVVDGNNMRYLSGFTGATGYLYISKTKKIILTDFRYIVQANKESIGFEVVEVFKGKYIEAINDLLSSEDNKIVGFEDYVLNYNEYMEFENQGIMTKLMPLGEKLNNLRSIKTEDELSNISKAVDIGDLAFTKILDIIKPGMTELEIAMELEYIMKKNGAEKLSFESIIASGINASMPHATPSNKKIELGDFLTLDFGCVYNGYCSDMTRTVVIGKATQTQKHIYYVVLEAQKRALEGLKAGVKGCDVDKIARDYINESGYEGYFGHGLGHSVGLYIHENPRLSQTDQTVIQANMTETVEPGIYIPKFGGVRIEDLVVVKEDGYINFTHSDKNLIEL